MHAGMSRFFQSDARLLFTIKRKQCWQGKNDFRAAESNTFGHLDYHPLEPLMNLPLRSFRFVWLEHLKRPWLSGGHHHAARDFAMM